MPMIPEAETATMQAMSGDNSPGASTSPPSLYAIATRTAQKRTPAAARLKTTHVMNPKILETPVLRPDGMVTSVLVGTVLLFGAGGVV